MKQWVDLLISKNKAMIRYNSIESEFSFDLTDLTSPFYLSNKLLLALIIKVAQVGLMLQVK
jgi:hypothetical protein